MTRPTDFAYEVYISYAEAARAWVRDELAPRLKQAGLRFCSEQDFRPGAPRGEEFQRLIEASRKTLVILTPAYLQSEWCEVVDSMAQALDPAARAQRFIPLLKETCELPLHIRHLTYVNFVDPQEPEWAWRQVLTAVGAPPEQLAPIVQAPSHWHLPHAYAMPPNFTVRTLEIFRRYYAKNYALASR